MQFWQYDSRNSGWTVREGPIPCPSCGGAIHRVHRRLVDRLFSRGCHRFQCNSKACRWTGNLRVQGGNSIWSDLVPEFVAVSLVVIVTGVVFALFSISYLDRPIITEIASSLGERQ